MMQDLFCGFDAYYHLKTKFLVATKDAGVFPYTEEINHYIDYIAVSAE